MRDGRGGTARTRRIKRDLDPRCDSGRMSKVVYRSPAAARKAAKGVARHEPGKRLYVYQCRHCGGYHLSKLAPGDSA